MNSVSLPLTPSVNKKVLIIDDDHEAAENVKLYLTQHGGLDTLIQTDERLALHDIINFDPKVVLLDYLMPHHSGIEVLADIQAMKMKRHVSSPAVIFLTNYPEYRKQALAAGAIDYFVKTMTLPELLKRLQLVLAEPGENTMRLLINRGRTELLNTCEYVDQLTLAETLYISQVACVEVRPEGVLKKMSWKTPGIPIFHEATSLASVLVTKGSGNPLWLYQQEHLTVLKPLLGGIDTFRQVVAWPLSVTRSRYGLWLFYALNRILTLEERDAIAPFFSTWARHYNDIVEEFYRVQLERNAAAAALRRCADELNSFGFKLFTATGASVTETEFQWARCELARQVEDMDDYAAAVTSTELVDTNEKILPLAEIAIEIAERVKLWADSKGVDLEVKIDDSSQSPQVLSRPWRFVLSALLRNAVEAFLYGYTMQKLSDQKVRLNGYFHIDRYVIEVIDNGVGFSDAGRRHLCEKGWSSKGSNRGWALALVKEIVSGIGGKIHIPEDVPKSWSTIVQISLPTKGK